ncbi:aminotransferase class V-fold PLP-dependent enzyme [Acaryochloris sp. IP29b_bin.148]|uniref:aminotransferase class V-fold PLP-dependent enzyme n=1 Tax=Acaryochloris sp. IP29b_bin.148 TaxID=2969218 RepID=UPI002621F721|nr:aminotransferase class V-fold PLP-dependent enzyme [Acaryochloris sp. IP29b_bin.148]
MATYQQPALKIYRQQFPALANKLYFNYGGQGPLPQPALAAIQSAYTQMQELGPFTGGALAWMTEKVEETRGAIATELNVSPNTITLTESVSSGCNIALWGIPWQPGDHLLLSDCEHPSVIATSQQLTHRFGIEVSTFPLMATLNGGDPTAVMMAHLRPNTRLVVISHILWNTGQVLPLATMAQACRQAAPAAAILVDAAQSVGVLPLSLDELDVDFYAFTGHKWWCGPDGLGGLYVRPAALDNLEPTYIGWRGIEMNAQGKPTGWKPDSRRYEVATSAFPLFPGLTAAIHLLREWGTPTERYHRILHLSQILWEMLSTIPKITCLRTSAPESGLVAFQIEGLSNHRPFVQQLESQNIMVRLIADPNCVRACVHYLTLESEVEQLVQAIEQTLD